MRILSRVPGIPTGAGTVPAAVIAVVLSIVLAAALAVACQETETKMMECPGYEWPPADVADTGGGETGDVGAVPPWVGEPCTTETEKEDCGEGHTCVTKEFLEEGLGLVIPDLKVTNGMCSMLACPDDAACGTDAICYNNPKFSPIPFCLRQCLDMADCRWTEGYSCYKEKPEDELGACLPDALVVAIVCDDGHCE